MKEETIRIKGMSCGHCVRAVTEALESIEGVETHEVTMGEAKVRYDESKVDASGMRSVIEDAGYEVEG